MSVAYRASSPKERRASSLSALATTFPLCQTTDVSNDLLRYFLFTSASVHSNVCQESPAVSILRD